MGKRQCAMGNVSCQTWAMNFEKWIMGKVTDVIVLYHGQLGIRHILGICHMPDTMHMTNAHCILLGGQCATYNVTWVMWVGLWLMESFELMGHTCWWTQSVPMDSPAHLVLTRFLCKKNQVCFSVKTLQELRKYPKSLNCRKCLTCSNCLFWVEGGWATCGNKTEISIWLAMATGLAVRLQTGTTSLCCHSTGVKGQNMILVLANSELFHQISTLSIFPEHIFHHMCTPNWVSSDAIIKQIIRS